MAPPNPAMVEPVPLFEASRERAHQDAAAKAEEVGECLAA
jgi:FMN-dependent NADH-azoreductase